MRPLRDAGFSFLCACVWLSTAAAQKDLEYQSRGNRYEGLKASPVSGYDIELISARIDHNDQPKGMSARAAVSFYLNQPREVHVTIREQDYRTYYWMDRLKPEQPWRTGGQNVFEWPTDVMAAAGVLLSELGVVVRLDRAEPSMVEDVVPAILYYSHPPERIRAYLFTFKTNRAARLTASISRGGDERRLFEHSVEKQPAGRPFTIRWDSSQADGGAYRVKVEGYFLDSNFPFSATVRFLHRRSLK